MLLKAKFARFAAVGTGVAMTLGMAMPVSAQTVADLQAQIALLMAQLSSLQGGSASASVTFTQNLTVGSRGTEVVALQNMLIAQGHLVMPAGVAKGYFGALTKAAVARWQAANGVAPAAGYWGPISRARANAMGGGSTTGGSTSGGGTGALQGGEGSLEDFNELGDVEADIDEGDNDQKVLGVEFDAVDSDLSISRVDVDFTLAGGSGSTQLDNYIDEVSLMLDGKVLDSMDVDEASEDDDTFSFRFTGLNGVVREDDTAELYVVVDAVDNIDSGDTHNVTATIPVDGIRAVDAAGISDTYDGTAYAEDFTVGEATGGDLDISEGDDNPNAQVVSIDEDEDTDGVLVLAFDLEADEMDVNVDQIPVSLNVSEDAGVDGPVKRAILKKDGTTVDTVSIPASATTTYWVLFSDLDIDINEGDTAEFAVYVDLNDQDATTFATGTTLYASTTGSHGDWDVEDEAGDAVTPDGSVVNSGELLTFQVDGIQVTLVSTDESVVFAGESAGQKQVAEFEIVVDIKAVGSDIYVDKGAVADPDRNGQGTAGSGFQFATTTDSTTGTTTIPSGAGVLSVSGSTGSDTSDAYFIGEGQTRRFTLQVTIEAGIDGVAAVQLTGVNWDTDGASDTAGDNWFTSGLSDFKTDLMTLLII